MRKRWLLPLALVGLTGAFGSLSAAEILLSQSQLKYLDESAKCLTATLGLPHRSFSHSPELFTDDPTGSARMNNLRRRAGEPLGHEILDLDGELWVFGNDHRQGC